MAKPLREIIIENGNYLPGFKNAGFGRAAAGTLIALTTVTAGMHKHNPEKHKAPKIEWGLKGNLVQHTIDGNIKAYHHVKRKVNSMRQQLANKDKK